MIVVALLNGDATFARLSKPRVWCAWLILIS